MEKLTVQLIVLQSPDDKGEQKRLAKHALLEFATLPTTVALEAQELFCVEQRGNCLYATPIMHCAVNGQEATDATALHNGDRIAVGGYVFACYQKHEARPRSASSKLSASFAKCSVLLFVLLELLVIGGLTAFVTSAQIWDGSITKQRITREIDALNSRIAKIEAKDALKRCFLIELTANLKERGKYLRMYDNSMSRRQRRTMLQDLHRISEALSVIENDKMLAELPNVNVDQAVKAIVK